MYQSLLEEVYKQERSFGLQHQPPCSSEEITRLRQRVRNELNTDIPEGYVQFLRLSNGIDWNGLQIFASERTPIAGYQDRFIFGFTDYNTLRRDIDECKSLLIFGNSDMDEYVYSISTDKYEIRDRVTLDIMDEASSFEDLMKKAIEAHI